MQLNDFNFLLNVVSIIPGNEVSKFLHLGVTAVRQFCIQADTPQEHLSWSPHFFSIILSRILISLDQGIEVCFTFTTKETFFHTPLSVWLMAQVEYVKSGAFCRDMRGSGTWW